MRPGRNLSFGMKQQISAVAHRRNGGKHVKRLAMYTAVLQPVLHWTV